MNFDKNKLMLLMAERCLDPYEFCEKAGISYLVYNKTIKGKTKPKLSTIGKMAKALEVNVKDLLED